MTESLLVVLLIVADVLLFVCAWMLWACRAQANDAGATATIGFHGWWEYLED